MQSGDRFIEEIVRFKKLKLYTDSLASELFFYTKTLGFNLLEQNEISFSVEIGWSILTFEESNIKHNYHYCFLLPSNQLTQALEWMERRTTVIDIDNGRKIQHFEIWNADSFYFFDASGNIAEFIVRYDLNNADYSVFDNTKVLGVNEIGMPTDDIEKINTQLESKLQTKFWKGDLVRFGTNGNQEGIFLLPNCTMKNSWFPTSLNITPTPFETVVEHNGKEHRIRFENEVIKTYQT